MQVDKKELHKLLDAISNSTELTKLPPPPPIMDSEEALWYHKKLIRCKCCGEDFEADNYSVVDTGYVKAFDGCCSDCKKGAGVDNTCAVVCVQCKEVVARLEPYKDDDGFEFKKRHAYHIDACPDCNPNLPSSMVVEKKLYLKEKYKK